MKPGVLLLAIAAMTWCACAHPQTPGNGNAPASGRAPAATATSMNSRRDIVLAVANPLDPPAMHAGSNLLGYALAGNYGAGQHASSTLAAMQQSYRWREVVGWPIKDLGLYCIVLEPPPGTPREALLAALAKDGRVKLAEPLQDFSVLSEHPPDPRRYNDPYVNLQRGFVETDAAAAQTVTQGEGVDVAIVDTGVDTRHPDLHGRIRGTYNEVSDDPAVFNRDHHGTEVAGIIAADVDNHQGIVGIAPKAELSIYKACWYPNSGGGAICNSFTLAKALAAVLDNKRARIVNLSLGGPADPLLALLLRKLLGQDRIVIAAMPQSGHVSGFPDSVPGVIVVRSSDAGSPDPPGVLNAPGQDILTTQPNGGYDFSSGSSMAAAHVSGIAALLLSLAPKLDAGTVRELLGQSSRVTGGTLQVNAAAAVASLRGRQLATH